MKQDSSVSEDGAVASGGNDIGAWFKSAVSGLWYQNHEAAGDIAAVKVNGVRFNAATPAVPSAGLEEPIDIAIKEAENDLRRLCPPMFAATPTPEPQQCVASGGVIYRADAIQVIQNAREHGHADLRELIAGLRLLPMATATSEALRCIRCPHDPKWRDERGQCQFNANPDKLPCGCKCVFSTGAPADDLERLTYGSEILKIIQYALEGDVGHVVSYGNLLADKVVAQRPDLAAAIRAYTSSFA